jgi:hypothetical protein
VAGGAYSTVKVLSWQCRLDSAKLGPYASSGRAWRLQAVRDTHDEMPAGLLVAQSLPWVLEPTAFAAAETTASDHIGANRASPRSACCPQMRRRGGCE